MSDVIEDLVKVYKGAVPKDITASPLGVDIAYTIATMLNFAEQESARLTRGAHLGTATGMFLTQHAKDRGLRAQGGETEDQLRERLRFPPAAGTVSAIIAAVKTIIADAGDVFLIELPKDAIYLNRSFCFNRGHRIGGGRGVVIALIPASANAKSSIVDALRSKVSAGKLWLVEEYTLS
jgi:hypothetical protein